MLSAFCVSETLQGILQQILSLLCCFLAEASVLWLLWWPQDSREGGLAQGQVWAGAAFGVKNAKPSLTQGSQSETS